MDEYGVAFAHLEAGCREVLFLESQLTNQGLDAKSKTMFSANFAWVDGRLFHLGGVSEWRTLPCLHNPCVSGSAKEPLIRSEAALVHLATQKKRVFKR